MVGREFDDVVDVVAAPADGVENEHAVARLAGCHTAVHAGRTQKGLPGVCSPMYAIDLHAHTRFFHGRRSLGDRYDPVGVRLLTEVARRRGLDGVATTNHDYYTAFDPSPAVATLPGIEITTDRGHVLVVGPDPPAATKPGSLSPAEAVALAHDRDCAAIVAHPFRNSTVRELEEVPFDAIEVNGKHPRSQPLVEQLADERDLPLVGGSDATTPSRWGGPTPSWKPTGLPPSRSSRPSATAG